MILSLVKETCSLKVVKSFMLKSVICTEMLNINHTKIPHLTSSMSIIVILCTGRGHLEIQELPIPTLRHNSGTCMDHPNHRPFVRLLHFLSRRRQGFCAQLAVVLDYGSLSYR